MKPVGMKAGLLAMLATLCAVAAAQQPAGTDQETAAQAQGDEDAQQVREDDQEPATQPAPGPTTEEFEPTEQISEDLSVSFPVDI